MSPELLAALWHVFAEKCLEMIEALARLFWKACGSIYSSPTDNQLEGILANRYPKTTFHIVRNRRLFYRTIGEVLLARLRGKREEELQGSLARQPIRVGIVCGPMVLKVGREIERSHLVPKREDFSYVSFVAMNKAADRDSFQYSANYLAAFLSSLFHKSHSVAYSANKFDKQEIDRERSSPDILLCSVGTYPNAPKNYLQLWWEKAAPKSPAAAAFGPNCVGDFCLTPIDSRGRVTGSAELRRSLKEGIDPYPRFASLAEHKFAGCSVVLPINVEREVGRIRRLQVGRHGLHITGKEAIARAILKTAVVKDCVLERDLAYNLSFAVGDYLLEAASEFHPDLPVRHCLAYPLRGDGEPREIYLSDPIGRINGLCRIDATYVSTRRSLNIVPDIVISESRPEFQGFDFDQGTGQVTFEIDGDVIPMLVQPQVRKPGQLSLLTLQLAARCLQHSRQSAEVWDIGCGTGFIGLLILKRLGDGVGRVNCSDISAEAVACTQANVTNLHLNSYADRIAVRKADLFDAGVPPDSQDLIVFNPPFLPDGVTGVEGIDSGGPTGIETALRFCRDVRSFLRQGGVALLAIADYVDDGRILEELGKTFGENRVRCDERLIVYPHRPQDPSRPKSRISTAYEIGHRKHLEGRFTYRFETLSFGEEQFTGFFLRHYIAVKQPP